MQGMPVCGALSLEIAHDLVVGYDHGACLAGDGRRVPQVVSMSVGHEDRIQLREGIRLHGGRRVPFQERINQQAVRAVVNLPAVMAVISKSQHVKSS